MTKTELEKYRQVLQDMARGVRSKVVDAANEALRGAGGAATGELSNVPLHPADLGNATYENEVALSLLENEDHLLAQIVAALERIDRGTFGSCAECGKPIPTERLHALPYTPYCIVDAKKHETLI